jgi:hypothetical protein
MLVVMMLSMNVSGCAWFSGPADEEVSKAIMDTGLYSGGVERFSLKSPLVILEKKRHTFDGYWQVKVKLNYSYTMADGREIPPTEKTAIFRLFKIKDNFGNTAWKAVPGS